MSALVVKPPQVTIRPDRNCADCGQILGPRLRLRCPSCQHQHRMVEQSRRRESLGIGAWKSVYQACVFCGTDFLPKATNAVYCPQCKGHVHRRNSVPDPSTAVETYIYFLLDGDRQPMYVGVSIHPRKRHREHWAEALAGGSGAKCRWLRTLDSPPSIEIVGPFTAAMASTWESILVDHWRRLNPHLTNTMPGGQVHSDDNRRLAQSLGMKRAWVDRRDSMLAGQAKRGDTWLENNRIAARKRTAVREPCPHCGRLVSVLSGSAASHIAICALGPRPCGHCQVPVDKMCKGLCSRCYAYHHHYGIFPPPEVLVRRLAKALDTPTAGMVPSTS